MVVLNLSVCGLNGVNLAFGLCGSNHMVVKICEGSTVHGSLKSGMWVELGVWIVGLNWSWFKLDAWVIDLK